MTQLMELVNHSYKLKKEFDTLHDKMRRKIGFAYDYGVARMSIALSLSDSTPVDIDSALHGDNGKILKGPQLLGKERAGIIVALIVKHAGRDLNKSQFSNAVTAHWVRGLKMMDRMWEESENNIEDFIKNLLRRSGFGEDLDEFSDDMNVTSSPQQTEGKSASCPVDFAIGESKEGQVSWRVNAPGGSPHLAVMGQPNTGKTRLALNFAQSVQKQNNCSVIVFDMGKGDIAGDSKFVSSIGASVINCSNNPVPLDVLFSSEDSRERTALRFTAALSEINRFGDVQKGRLQKIVSDLLSHGKKVSIHDVKVEADDLYKDQGLKEDTVTASLSMADRFNLLTPELTPADFFQKSWVLDMHEAEEPLQRFVAFLVLSAFNTYIMRKEDAPVDREDNRKITSILVVDEARKVLGYDHPALTDIVKMSRSKGGVVVLCSQSPEDYSTSNSDFLSDIGAYICFRSGANPASIKKVFKQSINVSDLDAGQCVVQLPGLKPQRVKAWK